MTTIQQPTKFQRKPQLNKNILVISHANCDDGLGAAWAAWKKFGDTADYWFAFYRSEIPDVKGKEVYILDFSYSREVLVKAHSEAKSLLVLDHHDSAEQDLKGLDFCTFDMTRSGAVMAWEYFHPGIELPLLLYHIQDNDLWKFECPATKDFIRNLRSHSQTIETFNTIHEGLSNPETGQAFYEAFKAEGAVITRYYNIQKDQALKATKQEIKVGGVKGLVCNLHGMFASDGGHDLAMESGTYGMTYFIHSNGDVKCSLRSTDKELCNVAVLAKKFGGGGHPTASGFTMSQKELFNLLGGKDVRCKGN